MRASIFVRKFFLREHAFRENVLNNVEDFLHPFGWQIFQGKQRTFVRKFFVVGNDESCCFLVIAIKITRGYYF